MSRYVQFFMVGIYGFLFSDAVYVYLVLSGILRQGSYANFALCCIIFMIVSFSFAYWLPDCLLMFQNVRKPILEEENQINSLLQEIQEKAHDATKYNILIEETKAFNAYAIGLKTIVLSKQVFTLLETGEIKGVLAHEVGHLRTKDSMACTVFFVMRFIPRLLVRRFFMSWKQLKRWILLNFFILSMAFAVLFMSVAYYTVFSALAFLIVLVYALALMDACFHLFWLLVSRYTEYRQDAFAASLGYAPELKSALLKLIGNDQAQVSVFGTISESTHPVIHNRIRRLEKMSTEPAVWDKGHLA